MAIHISKGNMKIGNMLNFSLPPISTCPNATEECKSRCYALKAWKQYPNVRKAWLENYEETQKDTFVNDVKSILLKKKNWKVMRLSVSGDFYDQSYLNKWIEIAKVFKDKVFYSYTKSHHLDFSQRPKNMIVLLSDDKGILKEEYPRFNGVARVVE